MVVEMKIEKITNQIAQENTYLLSNSSFCLVIDPGSEPAVLLEAIERLNKPLCAILLTHAHFDHIMGLEALKKAFPAAPVYVNELEKEWLSTPELNASLLLLGKPVTAPATNYFYEMGKTYDLGGFKFSVLATPGHSIGGVSLCFAQSEGTYVFTGDALFKNTIGRWDLPTGNQEQLLQSIRQQLFSLPDEFQIFPGHGPSSTIGAEKRTNPFF